MRSGAEMLPPDLYKCGGSPRAGGEVNARRAACRLGQVPRKRHTRQGASDGCADGDGSGRIRPRHQNHPRPFSYHQPTAAKVINGIVPVATDGSMDQQKIVATVSLHCIVGVWHSSACIPQVPATVIFRRRNASIKIKPAAKGKNRNHLNTSFISNIIKPPRIKSIRGTSPLGAKNYANMQ